MENNACDFENLQLNEATASTTTLNTNSDNVVGDDAISSTTSDKFVEQASSSSNCDAEADFLEAELSISSIQGEKITENVEDIVQDLENLLGESADSYRFDSSRNESYTEVNSTQELQNDKLYEKFRNELELHLSSQEVSSVEKEADQASAVTETQVIDETSRREISDVTECEAVQSSNLSEGDKHIPESANDGIAELIDGNTFEGVDNVSIILDDHISGQGETTVSESLIESGIPEVCELLDTNFSSLVQNELSEAITDPFIVDSTEKIIDDALQTTDEISELDLACKNIQMEVENVEEMFMDQCDVPSEESIAVASIMQEVSNSEDVSFYQNTEDISVNDEVPIPDTSTEAVPSPEDTKPAVDTELRQPLTVEVEVEESSSNNPNNEDENTQNVISATATVLSEELDRAPLKMTITKSENVHSILKIYDPTEPLEINSIPKIAEPHVEQKPLKLQQPELNPTATKSSVIQAPQVLSPLKITIQNIRNDSPICVSPVKKSSGDTYSPKITIKPIVKPDHEDSILKSALEDKLPDHSSTRKILQTHLERHSPKIPTTSDYNSNDERPVKLTIKPILKEDNPTYVQEKYSPKITIKPIVKPPNQSTNEERPAKITIKSIPKLEEPEIYAEERHSPKITIKPIRKPEEIHTTKITIKPVSYEEVDDQKPSPKITIKPIVKPLEDFENSIDNQRKIIMKPIFKPVEEYPEDRHSPKITIKPILKPDDYQLEHERHTKITIKSIPKLEVDSTEGRHSPKITIKPIRPPEDVEISIDDHRNSKLIIKSIPPMQKFENLEEKAPRITIKPVLKPTTEEFFNESSSNPRITIKPVIKPQETYDMEDAGHGPFKLNIKPIPRPVESSLSPKITIKPVPKQEAPSQIELIDFEEQIKQERIVLKIPKNRKNENERVNKIKVKLSKEQGIAQILPLKRLSTERAESSESKYSKMNLSSDLSISLVPNLSETAAGDANKSISDSNVKLEANAEDDIVDPLAEIPVFEITLESASAMNAVPKSIPPPAISIPPAPRKRGRPRKVPLEVREDFKDPKDERVVETIESTRPKRSCRGTSVRATLGIRVRKPRGGGTRGRVGRPPGSKTKKDRRSYNRKSKDTLIPNFKDFDVKHGEFKHVPLPIDTGNNVVIYEEETRMSAENSSRAHTPAKQVLTEVIDESQSSIQSNTTTESGEKLQKVRKGSRLEVHQEPEGEVISADKLAEYSWGGGGPYMLQEQVAQFLGIKSFKRKYPGIHRRTVDMQERDFIRESCLASEAMCDMGLTAVKSEDILDIMYTDFQHKYEEYCKHQRDRQAKDVSNKQKALSLAASQEKNKLDIVEQAVQSAFQWNANFNKARKEQRRACLDLQTFTVHFPKGKMKQINKPSLGLYPVALVPGQYSDYYRKYTPLELSRLPFNTVGRKIVSSVYQDTEDSQSDASGSDSDSSSSDSDSSYSGSSVEDCKMCGPVTPSAKKIVVH